MGIVTNYLWRALVGRVVIVALSGLILTGVAVADEIAQPEHIHVPATAPLHQV